MVLRGIIIIFLLLDFAFAQAQTNDDCVNATFISIPATGDTCLTTDNLNSTADAYFNTCDQNATPPLPPGGNEVWFTYVATGDSNIISVASTLTPTSMIDPSITVLTGNCGTLATMVCNTGNISAGVNFNVAPGTQVWFYVSALTTDGDFDLCITSTHNAVTPGDCNNLTRICDKQHLTIHPDNSTSSAVVPSCFPTAPLHPQWLVFTVGTTGTFEFTGSPANWPGGGGGSRWALFEATDPANPCNNPSVIMCNAFYMQNVSPVPQFGMDAAVTGCTTSAFCPSAQVDSGKTYLLLIDDINGNNTPIELDWGGTFEIAPTSHFNISTNYICGYDSMHVTYAGNGTSTDTYTWNPPQASNDFYLHYAAAGNYTVSLKVDNGVCSSYSANQVTVFSVPVANAGSDLSFCGSTGQYIMGLPPTPGYIYQWMPNLNINYPDSSQTPVYGNNFGVTDSVVNYTLIATLGICTDSDDVKVTIHPRQAAFFNPPAPQCFTGNSFNFQPAADSVPNATFNWTFQNAVPATGTAYAPAGVEFPSSGQFTITLTAQSPGCPTDFFSDVITVFPNPVVSFYSTETSGCPPLDALLINTSPPLTGGTYAWNPGNGIIDTIPADTLHVIYDQPGIYIPTLTLTSTDGCASTDTINTPITVLTLPDASFHYTPEVIEDINPDVTFFNTEPNGLCFYTFGDGDSSFDCQAEHLYADTGSYYVQLVVTGSNGCIDTTYRIVEVKKFFTLYIPTAFSPNNDGRNDAFVIKGDGVEELDLKIFNRRGQMVFRSDAINKVWKGTHMDTEIAVPDGVYVYDMTAKDSNKKKHHFNGFVTVIR